MKLSMGCHRGGGANEWRGQPAGGILEQAGRCWEMFILKKRGIRQVASCHSETMMLILFTVFSMY